MESQGTLRARVPAVAGDTFASEARAAQHTAFMDSLEPGLRSPPPPPSPHGLAIAPNTAPVTLDVESLRRAPSHTVEHSRYVYSAGMQPLTGACPHLNQPPAAEF